MAKRMLATALAALVSLAMPLAACADSGHDDAAEGTSEGGHSGTHGAGTAEPSSLSGAWAALVSARDAISDDVESGALANVHAKAEPLPELADSLLDHSRDLEPGKRARVEGAVKQVARVADALHVAADRGDATRTRKELERLNGLLDLIRAQYPAAALDKAAHGQEGHSVVPGHSHGAHAHSERPAGIVNAAPRATLRIEALDELRFEPRRLEVRAGVPTRIELVNAGAADHSLVARTPDGERDWVHLHALPGTTIAATYQLDEPGTYPVLCTIAGHTEGGMVGELVVLAGTGSAGVRDE